MQVEKLIFGDLKIDSLSVKFNNYLRVLPVTKGDKVLLFLADYGIRLTVMSLQNRLLIIIQS